MKKKRLAILTGGGDAPGLNSVIESCARVLLPQQVELVGIVDGFEGVFKQNTFLIKDQLLGLHANAGTLLGTSNYINLLEREKEFLTAFKKIEVDGMIVCGGDGTFASLKNLRREIPIIGVPKTIDNDLSGTDVTFGFDTACSVVAESVDALRFTAEAHRRIFVVEAMGRTAGWIALGGGLASYADAILIPERPFDKASLKDFISRRKETQRGLMIVISEGAAAKGESASVSFRVEKSKDPERFGGIGFQLARWLDEQTAWEARHVVLGHLQRSRHPTTADRFLTLAMGVKAAELYLENSWGQAVVYRQGKITTAAIENLMEATRLVPADHEWVKQAQALNIFI